MGKCKQKKVKNRSKKLVNEADKPDDSHVDPAAAILPGCHLTGQVSGVAAQRTVPTPGWYEELQQEEPPFPTAEPHRDTEADFRPAPGQAGGHRRWSNGSSSDTGTN